MSGIERMGDILMQEQESQVRRMFGFGRKRYLRGGYAGLFDRIGKA
ncbi:hypothetical protein J4211_03350 [Candidatus Woesearchaeota archaeon]|nr:hypothetical protein [Candidatus Woesearchaeota archaeon]